MTGGGPRGPGWGGRALAAVAVLVLYVVVLRPLRPAYAELLAAPLVAAVEAAPGVVVEVDAGRGAVRVLHEEGLEGASWSAPPGVLFLIPALVLAAVFPRRPYWAVLLGYHLGLGVAQAGLLALGAAGSGLALAAFAFTRTYLAHGVGLAATVLLVLSGWPGGRGRGGPRPAG